MNATPAIKLSDSEQKVLEVIPRGGASLRELYRRAGVARTTAAKALEKLEQKGLVERSPNPWGPETPWWFEKLPPAPAETPEEKPLIVKDAIYDRGPTSDKTWLLLNGKLNEFGCAEGLLHVGEHRPRRTWVPLHLLNNYPWYTLRRRGEVTVWSSQFSCAVHGECTEEMVTTAKTCALCGTLLTRH